MHIVYEYVLYLFWCVRSDRSSDIRRVVWELVSVH